MRWSLTAPTIATVRFLRPLIGTGTETRQIVIGIFSLPFGAYHTPKIMGSRLRLAGRYTFDWAGGRWIGWLVACDSLMEGGLLSIEIITGLHDVGHAI